MNWKCIIKKQQHDSYLIVHFFVASPDEVKPTIEMANKIANALKVSLDFLVGNTDLELDTETLKRVEDISKLSDDNKKHIYILLDALIRDFKTKEAYA